MSRNWPRASYRKGDAEYERARMKFEQGNLDGNDLTLVLQLARSGKNRSVIRDTYKLRGLWRIQNGDWLSAAQYFDEAVRMAHEIDLPDPISETWLAFAHHNLSQLDDPRDAAERLTRHRKPAHLPLAHLWRAVGDIARAAHHGYAAYREAWADGEPFVHRYNLNQAEALIADLGETPPVLPPYDAMDDAPFDFEGKVAAVIANLRLRQAEKQGPRGGISLPAPRAQHVSDFLLGSRDNGPRHGVDRAKDQRSGDAD